MGQSQRMQQKSDSGNQIWYAYTKRVGDFAERNQHTEALRQFRLAVNFMESKLSGSTRFCPVPKDLIGRTSNYMQEGGYA